MSVSYKVWAQIERERSDGDYEDVDEPVGIGYYDTLREARKAVADMSCDGYDSQGKCLLSLNPRVG